MQCSVKLKKTNIKTPRQQKAYHERTVQNQASLKMRDLETVNLNMKTEEIKKKCLIMCHG